MEDELFFRIALTMIPELGPVRVKTLIERFGDAAAVFKASKRELGNCLGSACADQIKAWKEFQHAEAEIGFLKEHNIKALFLTDAGYPRRLLHCYDPPALLYYCGNADLNHARVVSIIGTRNLSGYGKQVTEELVGELKQYNVVTVSGLAFGIDAIAHKTSLDHGIPTIGVLGHGLDTVYPSQHKTLAKEMQHLGGLLTEFRSGTLPDKHNFPKRNRIVAGMADATVVIETAVKGGSMITATLAHGYNRDLFAVPGRLTDLRSRGCLELVRQNKAILFTDTGAFIETMGWLEKKRSPKKQKELFIELSAEEQAVVNLLINKESIAVDELFIKSRLSNSSMANAILNLELQHVIKALPGKRYQLC